MKILYVTTVAGTMSFFLDEFNKLINDGNTVELACNCYLPIEKFVDIPGIKVYDIPFSRSPFARDNLKAYWRLKKLIKENNYQIIHCHTPIAAAITRLVCKKIKKYGTKVIYTAHGLHFYKGAPKKNWLLYYPVEWLCAHWTDTLITINDEDYKFSKKKLKAKKIEYVPGVGIDLKKFCSIKNNRDDKRKELNIPKDAIVLFSVGELNQNKNHETVLRAIAGLDVYYIIAGVGNKEKKLCELAKEINMVDRFQILGYRKDIVELLQAIDIFVFPSFREGLSVSLMEAMACGKPAVVSNIRGNIDLIDENGGGLFEPHSVEECRRSIQKVINADRKKMGNYNREKVKKFSVENVLKKMGEIYEK